MLCLIFLGLSTFLGQSDVSLGRFGSLKRNRRQTLVQLFTGYVGDDEAVVGEQDDPLTARRVYNHVYAAFLGNLLENRDKSLLHLPHADRKSTRLNSSH